MEYILVQSFFVFLLMMDTCGADTQSDSWKDMLRGYLSGQLSSSYHTEAFRHEFRRFINIIDKKNENLEGRRFMGGSSHAHSGAAVDSLCLPRDPERGIHNDRTGTARAYVYGTEYEIYHFSNHIDKLVKHDVPCVVCLVKNRSILTTFPDRTTSYKGWSLEYDGYLIAGNYAHPAGTMYRCLDKHPESLPGGSDRRSGSLVYPVEARRGSLRCPPYIQGRELACVVCSKE